MQNRGNFSVLVVAINVEHRTYRISLTKESVKLKKLCVSSIGHFILAKIRDNLEEKNLSVFALRITNRLDTFLEEDNKGYVETFLMDNK